jgi:hypothetical protein
MLLVLETIANGAAMLVAHPVRIRISPFFSKASSCVRSSNTLREALPLLYTRRVGVGAESGDGGEFYTVAAISGKQVVSNAERGGMVCLELNAKKSAHTRTYKSSLHTFTVL